MKKLSELSVGAWFSVPAFGHTHVAEVISQTPGRSEGGHLTECRILAMNSDVTETLNGNWMVEVVENDLTPKT